MGLLRIAGHVAAIAVAAAAFGQKIDPQVRERAQSEAAVPVFIVLAHQPQREILQRAESANALYRQVAESRYRQAAGAAELREAREAAESVVLRTRQQAFQAIEQAVGPEQDALEGRLRGLGATRISRYLGVNMLAAEIPAAAIAALEADPEIARVSAVEKLHPQLAASVPDLGAPAFWNAGYTGQGESVGVLDTGVRTNHPAFAGVPIVSQVFLTNGSADPCFTDDASSVQDKFGHGTHVAGIVASQGSAGWANYQGVAKGIGTLYNLKVGYSATVYGSCGPDAAEGDQRDILAGLDWAVRNTPVRIFNLSFGSVAHGDDDDFARSIDRYIDDYELVFAIAAGNGRVAGYGVSTPGIAYNGITVANWESRGTINPTSSTGTTAGGRYKPDLAAPGTNITSTSYSWDASAGTSDDFIGMTGTSMAAPHIAGAAALLESAGVRDPLAVKALLINTADNQGPWQGDAGWGYTNLTTALGQLNYITGTIGSGGYQFYRMAASGNIHSTLTWNRHVSGDTPSLNDATLRLFQADTGDEIYFYSGNIRQNVIQAFGTYTGDVVLAVNMMNSPLAGVASEPFAIAFSAPAVPVIGPRIVASCDVPPSIAAGSQFTVACSVSNYGDLPLPLPTAQVTLPLGFTNGSQTPLNNVAPGATATSYLTVTAPATEGTYTIRWNITTPRYLSLPAFNALSSATTTVHLALPAPALVSPANGTIGASLTPTLAWTPSAGATLYDVYFGASWPPPLFATAAESSYTPETLLPGTQYYWHVVARNGSGASASATWSFTTRAAVQSDQIIVTVAGGGSGPMVDGEPATSAQLSYPYDIAVDASANLYLQDGIGTIRKVTPDGIITTVAQFPNVGPIATDASGSLYVASGSSVARIAPDHTVSTLAGNGTSGYSGDGGPATSAQIAVVGGLAVSALGDLYISDMGNCVVRKVAPNGLISTVAGNGTCGYSGDGGPAKNAQLSSLEGVAVDPSGAVYIADTGNSRIRKLTPDGVITTVAGNGTSGFSGDGGPAVEAQLSWPNGLAFDGGGDLYFADGGNGRVRKVTPGGIITTVAGNGSNVLSGEAGPPLSAGMSVWTVAVDKRGNLYIAEPYDGRVRAVVPANPPSCQFRVDRSAIAAPGAGGVFPVSVQTGPGCWWGASGLPMWITGPSSGRGPSTVNLAVAASNDYFRTAILSIAGAAVSITQADGWCALAVSPASAIVPAAGGTVEVSVAFCAPWPWLVSNPPDWVAVAGPGGGDGSGSFRFTVAPNTGAVRYGTLRVGQPNFTESIVPIMQLAAPTDGLRFVPVPPCRVADTRVAGGGLGGNSTRSFSVAQANCGVPGTAQAYSLNVTVVPEGGLSYLTLWPTGQNKPLVSTLNSFGGIVVANAAIVPAGFNGAVSVYVTDPTDVILDIDGYFDSAGTYAFYPVEPCRVADTRYAAGPFGGPALTGAASRDFAVASSPCGLPSTASAYSMNVTVVPAGYLGYLKTWPAGQTQPNVSTLNSWTGKVVANAALVPAGNGGAISVYAEDATQVVLDTNGYFGTPGGAGGLNFYPVTPCRVADTRGAAGPFGGPKMGDGEVRSFPIPSSGCGIPATAAAYSLNVTVVPDGMLQYLTAWPAGAGKPLVSTLNSWDGAVVANAAIVPAGTGGAINVFVANRTQVILDINGYFAP